MGSRLAASVILALACVAGAQAQTRPSFEGQTISLVVGFGVGGGYGTYSRLLARFLGNHIPGHPAVIVRIRR
jgi:tripartite-type tricarboxylate transporter receptor subunit TctC